MALVTGQFLLCSHHIIGGRYIEGLNLTSNYLRLNCGSGERLNAAAVETVQLVRRSGDFLVVRPLQTVYDVNIAKSAHPVHLRRGSAKW